jgi:hypothetical protein
MTNVLPQDNGTCLKNQNAWPWSDDFWDSLEIMFNELENYPDPKRPYPKPVKWADYYTYSNTAFDVLAVAALNWPAEKLSDTTSFGQAWSSVVQQYCTPIGGDVGHRWLLRDG